LVRTGPDEWTPVGRPEYLRQEALFVSGGAGEQVHLLVGQLKLRCRQVFLEVAHG
jgi:hypothetical protein